MPLAVSLDDARLDVCPDLLGDSWGRRRSEATDEDGACHQSGAADDNDVSRLDQADDDERDAGKKQQPRTVSLHAPMLRVDDIHFQLGRRPDGWPLRSHAASSEDQRRRVGE